MPDRVGQSLGNYRLTRLLGRGGFAEVYLAEHKRLGTQAAIKVLYTHISESEEETFLAEARTIAHLEHPHIVRILDFDVQEGTPFLVMSYASNGTLRQRHPKDTRLPIPLVLDYLKQIASALQYAHDEKVIHRDIKPENILLGRHNELLLSDFGIALIAQSSRLQSTQEVVGTAAYMSPEQLQGRPRLASDQYALAVVVYEWLTGDRPFHGTFVELYSQHLSVPPPSLRSKVSTLSPELDQVILTALAKDPSQRFASVKAFATAFEQAILPPSLPTRASQGNTAPTPVILSKEAVPPSAPLLSTTITPPDAIPVKSNPLPSTPLPAESAHTDHPPTPTPSSANQQQITSPTTSSKQISPLPRQGRSISRRSAIIGLTTLTIVGGGAWILLSQSSLYQGRTTQSSSNQGGIITYTYKGHSGTVTSVAWSPDGKRIASGSADQTVQVWNATNGSSPFTYKGHSSYAVNAVIWSPDGKRIASGSADNTVQVWNATNGSSPFTYKGHSSAVNAVIWSPDGKRIASGSADNIVQVWNAADGSSPFTYKGHTDAVHALSWSSDSKRIASGSYDKTVRVWNATDGSFTYFTYEGHSGTINAVAWSPDSKRIASGSYDGTVQVWNAADGSSPFTYTGHSASVYAVAWSPDGKWLASGSYDGTVQVWHASDGSSPFTYTGHTATVNAVAWSPDGKLIASGSDDTTIQVWKAP